MDYSIFLKDQQYLLYLIGVLISVGVIKEHLALTYDGLGAVRSQGHGRDSRGTRGSQIDQGQGITEELTHIHG